MPKTKTPNTPGQKLFLSLMRSDAYDQEVAKYASPTAAEKVTKRWMEGMSRSLKEKFANGVREQREKLALTQDQLAERAGLTATAVAMIERGERSPSLDTATRLCWALDVAAGLTLDDL